MKFIIVEISSDKDCTLQVSEGLKKHDEFIIENRIYVKNNLYRIVVIRILKSSVTASIDPASLIIYDGCHRAIYRHETPFSCFLSRACVSSFQIKIVGNSQYS